jgi:uncharacterized membrane protein (UPF0136 family)
VLNLMPVVYFAYAAILLGGGIMGFVAAKSSASLIGSSVFAAVSVVAAVLTRSNPSAGLGLGLINALAVGGFFVYRYLSTGKPMPAFPSIALSLLVVIVTLVALGSARQASGR